MAEELNCDLDDGTRNDCSNDGSKSSIEDAQEQARDTKGSYQATSDKMEDVLDLDYDEGSPNCAQERADDGDEGEASSDGEIEDSSDENNGKQEDGDKEEGEIEDSDEEGEIDDKKLRKVPIEARLSRPVVPSRPERLGRARGECPYEINGSCTWGPDCSYTHRNKVEHGRLFARVKVAEESSWERGLREAREAMRRASKKREEPEFEIKRLTAAPTGERIRSTRDSDSDESSPRRRSPQSRHSIPSLLDINTLAPPRFQGRSSAHKDGVRNATRGSPCYSEDDDVPATRLSVVDSGRFKDRSEGYRERREIKDLGPQVRYPCGRPTQRRSDARRSGGDSGAPPTSRPEKSKESSSSHRSRRSSPHNSTSTRASRSGRISPSLDASPISSDSSLSPTRSPRKSVGAAPSERNGSRNAKKKNLPGGAMGDVTDPWARKKKANTWGRGSSEVKQRERSTSNSSSTSSNSSEKLRRAAASTSSSRPSRRQRTPPSTKVERRLSPPRGDITGFRIPKKHRGSSKDRIAGPTRSGDAGRDAGLPKKSSKSGSRKNRTQDSVSDEDTAELAEGRGAEVISDSDSAQSASRSSSVGSSSSSGSSSRSRSASPALPAKYRVVGNKEDPVAEKNASLSDSDSEDKSKSRNSKGSSKAKRAGEAPPPRELSPSPSPPPPPPPPEDNSSRRRTRENSATPPPPPPLPLISEFGLERQSRKSREPAEKRPSTEKSKQGVKSRSPPKKKAKPSSEGATEKERRKRELMEQLRAVEAELKKRTAAAASTVV